MARWLLTPAGKLSNESASDIYKRADAAQRQQVFADICLSIIGTMDSTFKVLVSCYNSKEFSNEMNEAYNVFLNDLNTTIGALKIQ